MASQDDLDALMASNFCESVARHTRSLVDYVREMDDALRDASISYPAWETAIEHAAAASIGQSAARRALQFTVGVATPSPLERVMAHALRVYAEYVSGEPVGIATCDRGVHRGFAPRYNDGNGRPYFDSVSICQQHHVGPYMADFFILGHAQAADRSVVLEVDGHEFHEKTKQQAEHDKKRDRAFAAAGYTTLRFTGSEVFRDPVGCAKEAVDLALGTVGL